MLATVIAATGCDRVFGVEGTPSSVDAAPAIDTLTPPDGELGAYTAAVLEDRPIAYFTLDELMGPTATDSAGDVDGTYVGDIIYAQNPAVLSEPGTAPMFDQADMDRSGVLFGNDFAFDGIAAFTLELWILPIVDETHTFRNVISKWEKPPVSAGYIIYTEDGDSLVFARDSSTSSRTSITATINPNNWTHIVASYDGTTMTLSLNGEVVDSKPSTLILPSLLTNFVIGSASGNATTNPFRGQIDNVAIYDRSLTPARAHDHYEAAGVAD